MLGYREGDVEPSAPAPCGAYNVTGAGRVASWAQIAVRVFDLANGNADCVRPVTTVDYHVATASPVVPRPEHSAPDLSKLRAAGFEPRDWQAELADYLAAPAAPVR